MALFNASFECRLLAHCIRTKRAFAGGEAAIAELTKLEGTSPQLRFRFRACRCAFRALRFFSCSALRRSGESVSRSK
jgi:hypothetical protein